MSTATDQRIRARMYYRQGCWHYMIIEDEMRVLLGRHGMTYDEAVDLARLDKWWCENVRPHVPSPTEWMVPVPWWYWL